MKAKLMCKVVSLVTGCMFIANSIAWSEPVRRAAVEQEQPVVSALAADSKVDEEKERKTVLAEMDTAQMVGRISAAILSAYDTVLKAGKEEISRDDVEKIKETISAGTGDFKPEVVHTMIGVLDSTETPPIDFFVVPLEWKGGTYLLTIRLKGVIPEDQWSAASKETLAREILPEVIKFRQNEDGNDYFIELHKAEKGLEALLADWRAKIAKDKDAAKISAEADTKAGAKKGIFVRISFKIAALTMALAITAASLTGCIFAKSEGEPELGGITSVAMGAAEILTAFKAQYPDSAFTNLQENHVYKVPGTGTSSRTYVVALNDANYRQELWICRIKDGKTEFVRAADQTEAPKGAAFQPQKTFTKDGKEYVFLSMPTSGDCVHFLIEVPAASQPLAQLQVTSVVASENNVAVNEDTLQFELFMPPLDVVTDRDVFTFVRHYISVNNPEWIGKSSTSIDLDNLPFKVYKNEQKNKLVIAAGYRISGVGMFQMQVMVYDYKAGVLRVIDEVDQLNPMIDEAEKIIREKGFTSDKNIWNAYRAAFEKVIGDITISADGSTATVDIKDAYDPTKVINTIDVKLAPALRAPLAPVVPSNLALVEDAESKADVKAKMEKGFLMQTWGKPVAGAVLKAGAVAADAAVTADAALDKGIADVDKKIGALLTEEGIKALINVDKLPAGVTVKDIIARIKDVLTGKTKVGENKDKVLEFCYLDGFTINDAVLLHAGKKYGRVYMPREMVKDADSSRVALAKLHEVLHHVFPEDANHTIIKNDTALIKGLLADMVEKSKAAVALNKKIADETLTRESVASVGDLRTLEKPDVRDKPVALWLTDDPDVNLTILDAAKRLVAQGRNVKIFMLAKEPYNFSAKDRKELMELKGKDGKPVVAAYVLLSELQKTAGKDIEDKMAAFASDVLGQKVEIADMACINSPYEEYQAVKVTRMPNIQPPARVLDQPLADICDTGKLMDVGELAVLAHRLVGDRMYDMTFDDLAKSLPAELQAQFLATVEALGLEKTENVATGFAKIPPTTSITGELQTSVNTMRATMIAA